MAVGRAADRRGIRPGSSSSGCVGTRTQVSDHWRSRTNKGQLPEHLVGDLVAPRLDIVVRVAIRVAPKRGAGLGLESVGTHVSRSGLEGEHSPERVHPVLVGLAPGTVDEVDTVGPEDRIRR